MRGALMKVGITRMILLYYLFCLFNYKCKIVSKHIQYAKNNLQYYSSALVKITPRMGAKIGS